MSKKYGGFETLEDNEMPEPPKTVVIKQRPWVSIDFQEFSMLKLLLALGVLVLIVAMAYTSYQAVQAIMVVDPASTALANRAWGLVGFDFLEFCGVVVLCVGYAMSD